SVFAGSPPAPSISYSARPWCAPSLLGRSMGELSGKRAIVTGAASGIGRASALLFAREGPQVLAVDIDQEVHAAAAAIPASGGRALAVHCDASAEGGVRQFVDECVREFGGVDVLFANAGISGHNGRLEEQTLAVWMKVLSVNLVGTFLAVREVLPHMKSRG